MMPDRLLDLSTKSTTLGAEPLARKPRDFDSELQSLMEKTKKVKTQKTVQLGELVQEALAGALLAALEQSKKQPEAIARWTERGQTFFQQGGKKGKKPPSGDTAPGTTGNGGTAPASDRAA
jgi:1,6-anhydro-N-acetylmuramate kinase